MENDIQIERLINNNRNKEQALCGKLDWLRLRCLLETIACVNGDVVSYENADNLMNSFLSDYMKGIDERENYDKIIENLKEKYDKEEFEKNFYQLLSEVNNEQEINDSWKKNAKVFIEKLNDYRTMGTLDLNISNQLMEYAKKINNDPLRYIYELIQNADDCEYSQQNSEGNKISVEVKIVIEDDKIVITYPEDGMTYSDIIAITTIGQSNKKTKKKKRIIGEKGRGFKTIFSVCDYAEIHSGPYHFKLSQESFKPEWIDFVGEDKGTKMILHFKNNFGEANVKENKFSAGADLFKKIKERYGFNDNENKKENILKNCPIIFTNNIEKLVIQYNNISLSMQRKKDISSDDNRKKGTLTVDYSIEQEGESSEPLTLECYWYEKAVEFTYDEYISHYKEIFKDKDEFEKEKEVKTYPIILIAPKHKSDEKNIIKEWKGNMFTYLPTFTNINAPISIHAPFELNEDRSCMWISGLKGDEHIEADFEGDYKNKNELYTTKWNRRLFSELFVDQENNNSLVKYAYEQLVNVMKNDSTALYNYLPAYKNNNHQFFLSQDTKYDECVDKFNSLCKENDKNIIFDNFKALKFLKCLYNDRFFCCNDKPTFFDDGIDNILLSIKADIDSGWISNCICNSENGQNTTNDNNEQKSTPIIKSLENCENILALGVSKKELNDDKKVEFANRLLKKAYDMTIKELVRENCSVFLPPKGSREKLKAIRINDKYMSPEDAELWMILSSDESQEDSNGESSCLKIIRDSTGVKDDNENDISIKKIYENNFDNCVDGADWDAVWKYIYLQKGNDEDIKCSFELYKALMCFFGNSNNWYEYSNECLNVKDEESNKSENTKFFIPADNLRIIWKKKYKEYRDDINETKR